MNTDNIKLMIPFLDYIKKELGVKSLSSLSSFFSPKIIEGLQGKILIIKSNCNGHNYPMGRYLVIGKDIFFGEEKLGCKKLIGVEFIDEKGHLCRGNHLEYEDIVILNDLPLSEFIKTVDSTISKLVLVKQILNTQSEKYGTVIMNLFTLMNKEKLTTGDIFIINSLLTKII